jgi:hypothetical protein
MRRCVTVAFAVILLASARSSDVRAQGSQTVTGSHPGWSVDHTMRQFELDLGGDVRGYFPTRGEWTWVVTTHHPGGPDRMGVWRFPAVQTDSAIETGPLCDSFHSGDFAMLGTVIAPAVDSRGDGEWRRVRGTRFVPEGAPAGSPVFVEWRREDGRWVVSSFGGEGWYAPPLLGRPVGEVVRDGRRAPLRLPLPAGEPTAAGAAWFRDNRPIVVAGQRLLKYGLPRPLGEGDVVRYGSLEGVGVYVEPQSRGTPGVVYVLVSRAGEFQPYQNNVGNGCEH